MNQEPDNFLLKVQHQISKRTGCVFILTFLLVAALISFAPSWVAFILDERSSIRILEYTNLNVDEGRYFPVDSPTVRLGEPVPVHITACNHSEDSIRISVSRRLISISRSEDILLEDTSTVWPPGCTSIISQIHTVPLRTPPGRYYLSGTSTVPTFPPRHLEWRTVEFDVVP